MKWDPFEGGSNFMQMYTHEWIHGTAIFTIHDIHVYLTFIVWYIYLHRIHAWYISVNPCFPAAVSALNQQMLNPQTTDNPKPLGWNKLKWKNDLQNQNLRGCGGPWTLKFSLRPSSHKLRFWGPVRWRMTWLFSAWELFRVWWVNSRVELCYPKFCGGCHVFFFQVEKSPMIWSADFMTQAHAIIQFASCSKKIPQDEWVICVRQIIPQFMAPKDSAWGRGK